MRPDLTRVPEFYHGYINQVKENDLNTAFENQTAFFKFLDSIPKEKYDYAYAPGKWTIREVLQHIIDGERIFCYRALRFARKDATPLPGFDENLFAKTAKADKREWNDLVEEMKAVRKSTELLFKSFDKEQINSSGTSTAGLSNYVLGFGYIIVGHCTHHMKIISERYL
jgi:DinB family protein